MLASILNLLHIDSLMALPIAIAYFVFWLWMLIDAIRKQEWVWVVFIVIFNFSAVFYYFFAYRATPSATRGFELPGAHDRRRIKQLQAQIHHLDKAHHHSQLGDIYFQRGNLVQAEASYRAAMDRDPHDLDTRAHLGQCLLRQKRASEAGPLIEGVISENPRHDYGYTLMALAECLQALGDADGALKIWKQVTANNSYPRAKVQLAEIYVAKNQPDLAREELKEVLSDDVHAPPFQRKRDRIWIRRAKALTRRTESQ